MRPLLPCPIDNPALKRISPLDQDEFEAAVRTALGARTFGMLEDIGIGAGLSLLLPVLLEHLGID
jgi:hypothetical protein